MMMRKRGSLFMPVWPSQASFQQPSLMAVTWSDLPPDEPVFMTQGGVILPPRSSWRVRAVVFDALQDVVGETSGKRGGMFSLIHTLL